MNAEACFKRPILGIRYAPNGDRLVYRVNPPPGEVCDQTFIYFNQAESILSVA